MNGRGRHKRRYIGSCPSKAVEYVAVTEEDRHNHPVGTIVPATAVMASIPKQQPSMPTCRACKAQGYPWRYGFGGWKRVRCRFCGGCGLKGGGAR